MSPRSRGAKRVAEAFALPNPRPHICSSCLQHLSIRRTYASQATASAPSPTPDTQHSSTPSTSPASQPSIAIKAGIIVSRPPLITPDPHPFETAFHLYQRRLNERLVLPFTQYFYYRRSTPTFEHWRKHRRERGGVAARDIGPYNAYTPESWNDEVLVGDQTGSPEKIVQELVREEGWQGEFSGKGDVKMAGLRRMTEADERGDTRSLERRLQRTLYLLVKTKEKGKGDVKGKDAEKWRWKFPSGPVVGFEGLKEAAQRILFTSLGPNMNTFFVGNHPVGHYIARFSSPQSRTLPQRYTPDSSPGSTTGLPTAAEPSTSTDLAKKTTTTSKADLNTIKIAIEAEKTFFMKARIMAGQADLNAWAATNEGEDLASNSTKSESERKAAQPTADLIRKMGLEEIEDFQWLSKDEVEKVVHEEYWKGVKNMLVAQ